jgi:hypothetical protein
MIKRLLILTFLFSIAVSVFGQSGQVPKDTIASRFLKGDMIIIKDWVLYGPIDYFDSVLVSEDTLDVILLDKDSAIVKYGYFGDKKRIYELLIPSFDSISYGYFIDKQILKYINPEKEIFYLINGAPCWNYSNALNLLANKKIIEIKEFGVNQATAIWGQKNGKNGALMINTDKKPDSIIIFK